MTFEDYQQSLAEYNQQVEQQRRFEEGRRLTAYAEQRMKVRRAEFEKERKRWKRSHPGRSNPFLNIFPSQTLK